MKLESNCPVQSWKKNKGKVAVSALQLPGTHVYGCVGGTKYSLVVELGPCSPHTQSSVYHGSEVPFLSKAFWEMKYIVETHLVCRSEGKITGCSDSDTFFFFFSLEQKKKRKREKKESSCMPSIRINANLNITPDIERDPACLP